jgi:asparagine synthase (glutamine-hydrolysing)
MSLVFGIIDFDKKEVSPEEICTLSEAVKWEGFKDIIETGENYALGYSHHPERDPKAAIVKYEKLVILADIRIYNSQELNKTFDFSTPVEAFAKAYLLWGMDCANRFHGDFAVVVIDLEKKEVHLFRDHLGVRPLVFWFVDKRLIFASHEFGLVKSGLIQTGLCEERVVRNLFRFIPVYQQTIFLNVVKVVPGFCFTFSQSKTRIRKYWKPEGIKTNKKLNYEDAVACLSQLLIKATLCRKEVGITGTHVSGGLDSSGVASILADHTSDKSKLVGYSWTPARMEDSFEGLDELELITSLMREKGITVKFLHHEENEFVENSLIPEFENMPNELSTMKMVSRDNVRTLFSGWGGDEFTSLSIRGTYNHLFFSLKWRTLFRFLLKYGVKSGLRRLRTEVFPLLISFGLLPVYQPVDWGNLSLIKFRFVLKHWKTIFFHSRKNFFGYGNRNQFMLNLLYNYHLAERMDNWTLFAEKYGFEYKYPLLDKELLEFWFTIPVEYTYRNMASRQLFREALKGVLTEKIRTRIGKEESRFLTYIQLRQKESKKYIENLLLKESPARQISFFRVEKFHELINKPESKKPFDEFIRINKALFYLRMRLLVKKYLPENQVLSKKR